MGYKWTLQAKPSGATIVQANGKYVAGATGSVTDVVKLTDSLTNTRTVNVTVGPGVSISPASGAIAPARWHHLLGDRRVRPQLRVGHAGQTERRHRLRAIGVYKAGGTGSVTDIVKVTDSLGNTAQVSIAVSAALAITPVADTIAPRGAKTYTATGGTGSYSFTLQTNASGGNIAQTSGAYTAGALPNVSDVIRLTDTNGATVTATSTVGPGITISPNAPAATPLGTVQFSATGGSGTGFKWVISVNPSGGAMNQASGLYRAGATTTVIDTVQVTDSLGNTATTTVNIGGALVVVPSDVTTTPRGAIPVRCARR